MSQVANSADRVIYEGSEGLGVEHILFIASDHEYRGEETCPAIARILAKRYGFKCTVLFGQTEEGVTGHGLARFLESRPSRMQTCFSVPAVH